MAHLLFEENVRKIINLDKKSAFLTRNVVRFLVDIKLKKLVKTHLWKCEKLSVFAIS